MGINLWTTIKILISILLFCSPIVAITCYESKREKDRVERWTKWINEEVEELKKIFPNEKIEYKDNTFYFNSYKRTIYPFSQMYILVHNFWLGAMAYKKIINKGQDKLTYEAGFKEACEKIKEELKIDAQNHVCVSAKITVNYIDKLIKEQKTPFLNELTKTLEWVNDWITDCETYPTKILNIQVSCFRMFKTRLEGILNKKKEK